MMSSLKESLMRSSSPSRVKQPLLRLEEEDELIRALREQISFEKELEEAKIQLVSKADFNFFDAFRIFDIDSRGVISISDLKSGLSEIGIFTSIEDLELYVKRYDKNFDGRLTFAEFCDSFTPNDSYHSHMINKRVSNNIRGRFYQRDDCFLS
jgi:Ca2+-binding EF-hand superfamily protein